MKPDEPWFLNQHGTWYKKMRQALKTACKNAKVPHCTHHFTETCSRDDSANEGKDIGTISKLLGHANPTITQNIYVHWRLDLLGMEKQQKSAKPVCGDDRNEFPTQNTS